MNFRNRFKSFWNFIQKALNCQSSINVDHRGMKGGGTFVARGGGDDSGNDVNNPYNDESGMEVMPSGVRDFMEDIWF